MTETPNLPISPDARLPATYEAARKALAECSRIDECKGWADKAAALASYALQAKDDSLRQTALRIQARAIRRCGELLKQVPRADGATRFGRDGAVPPVTRTQTATEAGLSERQRKTAIRVANVPDRDFERQVESSFPPTVGALAVQGTSHRPVVSARPSTNLARAISVLASMREFCEQTDPVGLANSFSAADTEGLHEFVAAVDQWLDLFVTNLPAEEAA